MAGDSALDVARVLLAGAAVAGIFGTATLKIAGHSRSSDSRDCWNDLA